jgi:F-type H+-transporting ATPase subunit gamma
MASLKAIRRRIASVRSTQQITRAMKFVAAARLRRAQEALLSARPYHETLARIADNLFATEREAMAPAENAQPEVLITVIGSDRGLCGGYNANLIRKAEEEAARVRSRGMTVKFNVVGRKPLDNLRRSGHNIAFQSINNSRIAEFALAQDLASRALSEFRTGKIAEASLIYSQFHSALSQRPTFERLLPVIQSKAGENEGERGTPADYLVEPSRAELVPVVLRGYLEDSIFHALLEAEASEQGARMTAMDSATNNASDVIGRLTLEMNRARQASITRELMDIVGGAEALRG